MADKKRSVSRENSQSEDKGRSPEQNNGDGGMSRDRIRLESPQTLPVPQSQTAQPHAARDMDQTVESQDDSPNCPDTQMAAGSPLNVVDNKGPVLLGAGATVVRNPTYNYNNYNSQHHHHHHHYHPPPHITNPDQYLRWVEQQTAALGPSPTHPGLPPCSVSQRLAGVQVQGHREEDTTDISSQSQTHRKTALSSSHHDNSSSFHVPFHCSDCLQYHQRDHPPLPELSDPESESRNLELSHHALPQLLPSKQQKESTKKNNNIIDRERRECVTSASGTQNQTKLAKRPQQTPSENTCLLPSDAHDSNPRQLEETSGVKSKEKTAQRTTVQDKKQSKREAVGQRSSLPSRPSPNDVTSNVTTAEQAGKGAKTVKATTHCENLSQSTQKTPRPDETSGVYREGITDSVCIIDSKGRSLEPGDAVWFDRDGNRNQGIYVGHQQVVWVDWRSRDRLVRKEELKLAQPFGKYRVVSDGDVRPFPRGEVIRRVESRVGAEYTEGDRLYVWDFHVWAMTGMGWEQVGDETAGTDLTSMSTPPIYTLCS